jgi:large-conductance mechanosensitive channel
VRTVSVDSLAKEDEMIDELNKIRTILEPKPAPTTPLAPKGLWAEFMGFISKYKVLGLTVGFIMGLYLRNLVQALVKDFLLPATGLAIPGMKDMATYAATVVSRVFGIGDFLVALMTFIIVAFVVFLIVKITKKWGID